MKTGMMSAARSTTMAAIAVKSMLLAGGGGMSGVGTPGTDDDEATSVSGTDGTDDVLSDDMDISQNPVHAA